MKYFRWCVSWTNCIKKTFNKTYQWLCCSLAETKNNYKLEKTKIITLDPDDMFDPNNNNYNGDPLEHLKSTFAKYDVKEEPQDIIRSVRDRTE